MYMYTIKMNMTYDVLSFFSIIKRDRTITAIRQGRPSSQTAGWESVRGRPGVLCLTPTTQVRSFYRVSVIFRLIVNMSTPYWECLKKQINHLLMTSFLKPLIREKTNFNPPRLLGLPGSRLIIWSDENKNIVIVIPIPPILMIICLQTLWSLKWASYRGRER